MAVAILPILHSYFTRNVCTSYCTVHFQVRVNVPNIGTSHVLYTRENEIYQNVHACSHAHPACDVQIYPSQVCSLSNQWI